jgi:uncharacterized SAM-binding protein YcdF (DUF218 family)
MGWLKLFFLPSGVVLGLMLMGGLLLLVARWRYLSKYLFISSVLLYFLFSTGIVSALLLSRLEYRYPALLKEELDPSVETIVLLAAYTADDPLMPLSGKFNSHALYRLTEAYNIYRRCRRCTIILSGDSDVVLMKRQLMVFGVPESRIDTDDASRHTSDSGLQLRDRLRNTPFYLVTSAGHMPRSMGVFRKQGLEPVPAPTGHLMPRDVFRASVAPTSQHLAYSDLAVHEYLALLWYRWSGKI